MVERRSIVAYVLGECGISFLLNTVAFFLVFFYLAPAHEGMPVFITQSPVLGVFSVIGLVILLQRLLDVFLDPFIAFLCDRASGKPGGRLRFLLYSAVPYALFTALLFFPIVPGLSVLNLVWFVCMMVLSNVAFAFYRIPYLSLMVDLSETAQDRVWLATWVAVVNSLGVIVVSSFPRIWGWLMSTYGFSPLVARQWVFGVTALVSVCFLVIPPLFIRSTSPRSGASGKRSFLDGMKVVFKNPYFCVTSLAVLFYFMGLTILMTGLPFFITVTLMLPEAYMGIVLPVTVLGSVLVFPLLYALTRRVPKKVLLMVTFLLFGVLFLILGMVPWMSVSKVWVAYGIGVLAAFPVAASQVLVNAIFSDIGVYQSQLMDDAYEGLVFACKDVAMKLGVTFGIVTFTCLTLLGKDRGADLGITLAAWVALGCCLVAFVVLSFYRESRLLTIIEGGQDES